MQRNKAFPFSQQASCQLWTVCTSGSIQTGQHECKTLLYLDGVPELTADFWMGVLVHFTAPNVSTDAFGSVQNLTEFWH